MTSRTSLCAIGLLLLAGCQCGGCGEPSAPPAPKTLTAAPPGEPPQPKRVLEAIVLELSGDAQVRRQGSEEWVTLAMGEPIRLGDAVRTGDAGEVSLGFGTAVLHVQQGSQLELQLFEPRRLRAQLQGSAEATAKDGALRLELTGAPGTLAALTNGKAAFRADGLSQVAAALEGKLDLSASGGDTQLLPGQLSLLKDGTRWGDPSSLDARPRLQVRWPERLLTNRSTLSLTGRAGRMTRVLVEGHAAKLTGDGRFEAEVHLRRGRQRIHVVAVDVLGHELTRSRVITMDPDAPTIKAQVHFR
jgi:hypothetical protein